MALEKIVEYYNDHRCLPAHVDMSEIFDLYRHPHEKDISHLFFEKKKNPSLEIPFVNPIRFNTLGDEPQFSNYKDLHFDEVRPFLHHYFSPSETIQTTIDALRTKYHIQLDGEYCGVFYRGNDKSIETNQPSYEEVIARAKQLPTMQFIVQTDELSFLQAFKMEFPSALHFEEIPVIPKSMTTVAQVFQTNPHKQEYIASYVASVFILASLPHLITTSGNGELFVALFRGHAQGIQQYLNRKQCIYGVPNRFFNPAQTDFWL